MRMRLISCFRTVALATALLLAGCSGAKPTVGPSTPSSSGSGSAPTVSSGLVKRADGSVDATGYVGHSSLEGGFWALYDRPAGPPAATHPRIVAVLLPGKVPDTDIAALKGSRVIVTGRLQTGLSTRQAGPELKVDTISGLTSDTPK